MNPIRSKSTASFQSVPTAGYPETRLRRTRQASWIRRLVRENILLPSDLILPLFIVDGDNRREAVGSLPGVDRLSVDLMIETAVQAAALGIPAIALFPSIDVSLRSEDAEESWNPESLVCKAVRALKTTVPNIGVICDVALDPYTTHGHDGLVGRGKVLNDATVNVLVRQAISLAEAGCDIVAPSDMMDGRVGAIRTALENKGFTDTLILSYAAKYESCLYGPFRDAVGSSIPLGSADKSTYQMDPANSEEALREVRLDILEGADMVMVKPGLPYLDVIRDVSRNFDVPVFAYQVSGEYAMLSLAAEKGIFDRATAFSESLVAFKRAGACGILTYAALEVAADMRGSF